MPQVALPEFIDAARSGELVSFPTDTVPALAVRPDRADRIFQAKQRDLSKPLILMAGTPEALWPYVQGSETEQQMWQQTADRFWPGALTLVLPASRLIPIAMNPQDPTTIGIRVPNHPLARYLLDQTAPLATTSVNRSGQPPLQTFEEINAQFPEVVTLHPDAIAELNFKVNQSTQGTPSTVIKWTASGWQVLRQGTIQIT